MPTYIVRAPETTLSPTVKASLAERITRVHAEVTAGAGAFVQVLFYGAQPDDCYLGGVMLRGPHCFIQGHIRAGRSALERADLIRALIPEVGDLLGVPRYAISASFPRAPWPSSVTSFPSRATRTPGLQPCCPKNDVAWQA